MWSRRELLAALGASGASTRHRHQGGALRRLRVESAQWRHRDTAGAVHSKATRGDLLSGNLYDWLGHVQFASETEDLLWYRGPSAIRFQDLRVHA